MGRAQVLVLVANVAAVAVTGVVIEVGGGLPSQLAHVYYMPVVASAALLPFRYGIMVALLAGAAVSPLPDVVHRAVGMDLYYENAVPWNLANDGWIVRPLAFLSVSVIANRLVSTHIAWRTAETTSASRGRELGVLSRIDRMVLAGSSELESVQEIARLAAHAMSATGAGIVQPDIPNQRAKATYVLMKGSGPDETLEAEVPLGGGVATSAIIGRTVVACSNVFTDDRFTMTRDFAQRHGYVAAVAAPLLLDGDVLGSLMVAYDRERHFSADEFSTLQRLADQASIAFANARQRESLKRLSYETAIGLAEAIEGRDPYTGDHCLRLSGYAALLAKSMGLDPKQQEVIRLGAALHDVGKIIVPDQVLKKPDRLTPQEYNIIKQHCYHGGQICKRISTLQAAYPIVYHHHERWDGRGYPDGLEGERIPLGARIVAVADAYDAITSDRPYRRGMSEEETRAILRDGAGHQWDPKIVETFLALRWETSTGASLRAAA